jgi:hypothetical protein
MRRAALPAIVRSVENEITWLGEDTSTSVHVEAVASCIRDLKSVANLRCLSFVLAKVKAMVNRGS